LIHHLGGTGQREGRFGVRPFTPHEQSCALRPGRGIDQVCQLDHPRTVPDAAVGLDRLAPVLFLDELEGVPDPPIFRVADGVVAVGLDDDQDELVGGPGRLGTHQDRVDDLTSVVRTSWSAWYTAGSPSIARSSSSRWWSASFDSAFPGRSMAARGSFVVSHPTPGGGAVHTFAQAAAAAGGIARSPGAAVASTARQAVTIEATGPNSSSCSRGAPSRPGSRHHPSWRLPSG